MAFVPVPDDLGGDLQSFNRNAVSQHAERLTRAVEWALPDAEFTVYEELAETALRDGESPAQLGALRSLDFARLMGIDLGEVRILALHHLM